MSGACGHGPARGPVVERVLWRGRLISAAIVLGALAGGLYVAAHDPAVPGSTPPCPFRALTGAYCPGCGTLRAVHHLLHGDLPGALRKNVLAVAAVPLGLWFLLGHILRVVRGRSGAPVHLPAWACWCALAVVVLYWFLRNIPVTCLVWLRPAA